MTNEGYYSGIEIQAHCIFFFFLSIFIAFQFHMLTLNICATVFLRSIKFRILEFGIYM